MIARLTPEELQELAAFVVADPERLRAAHADPEVIATAELRRIAWTPRIEKALAAAQRRARS